MPNIFVGPFLSDSSCKVDDPLSCNVALLEVCLFSNGTYKCGCPQGVSRLPDGRCKAVNECKEARLNDCDKNAECIDEPESYTCQCKPGFVDASAALHEKAGRICKPLVNECAEPKKHDVNCDQNALCIDTDLSYTCRCLPGYVDVSENYNDLPGRHCKEAVNECMNRTLHDCSVNALCEDAKEGYTCHCREGFVDVSPDVDHFPGRACVLPKKMAAPIEELYNSDSCDPENPNACSGAEKCTQIDGHFVCHCPPNAERFEDGTCTMINACDKNETNECDKNAVCSNIMDSYSCQCKPGFIDISEDPVKLPGRKCKEVVNECASVALNDCSPYAECIDTRESYACSCKPGYLDVSSQFDLPAGRKCYNTTNECAVRNLNTCDDNADCIDLPEGYTCQCVPGYVDVSSSAKLPPGRVCTIQTYCPSQPTDLMFLLDGSGSIGSSVFRDEILRFLRDFISLFNISSNKTRVAIIQFSDQIRHELDFAQSTSITEVEESLNEIHYLTGLTKTGNAIHDMLEVGFSTKRGARPLGSGVHRVAVVITDGRSQDVVTFSAVEARRNAVLVFAIGVTDHVSEAELIEIAGAKERVFMVKDFTGLDVRLRSLIQKAACPPVTEEWSRTSQCSVDEPNACDASKNEICNKVSDGFSMCDCPDGFERHPATNICGVLCVRFLFPSMSIRRMTIFSGGVLCNPEVKTSCAYPEVCRKTPYGNYRCICPTDHFRSRLSGHCVSLLEEAERKLELTVGCSLLDNSTCPPGEICVKATAESNHCVCPDGLERNAMTNVCAPPGSCDPYKASCDERRHEVCMKNEQNQYVCQCPKFAVRDPVTQVCLINECLARLDDCDERATCIDTRDGYLCQCPAGFLDLSNDPKRTGRICVMKSTDHCSNGKRQCSPNADCVNLSDGFLCRCKPGYIDFSPNPRQTPGVDCREKRDECSDPTLNDCSPNAICVDTDEGYICMCKPNFIDRYEFSKPGRFCEPAHANKMCEPGRNDCDRNAECFAKGANEFVCVCPSGYQDKSPNPISRPGRVCLPYIPVCDNPSLNDCDRENAVCTETGESFSCSCIAGFLDVSPDPERPGRLCKKLVDECFEGTHDCAPVGGLCEDTPDSYKCSCASGYADVSPDVDNKPGRICKPLKDECVTKSNDCSVNANCIDTADHYTCACKKGYRDASADPVNIPGRTCIRLINECEQRELNDCSPNAWCTDTLDSYQCHCKRGYVDRSPDMLRYPGRICLAKKVNECYLQQHDCSSNAICKDEEEGYSCRCREGFVDKSPNILALPGRVCEAEVTVQQDSVCDVEDANSCDVSKNEVCRLINNQPQCTCPEMYEREPRTGSCTVINECLQSELNNCSTNAICIDQTAGYVCQCKEGFKDESPNLPAQPGRVCKPLVNECEYEHLNDCHQEAECTDLEDGYQCRCKPGFVDISANAGLASGRACHKPTDECADPTLNTCDRNALCLDDLFGYRCQCPEGYLDVSPVPSNPGRACKKIVDECSSGEHDCDPIALCVDTPDYYKCICPANSADVSPNPTFPGRVCRIAIDKCGSKMHDCDSNADCSNTDTSFVCTCKEGFVDRSPNPNRPGRFCVKLVNECEDGSAQCSPNADCRDLQDGYTCECKDGFIDQSPVTHQPGRICSRPDVCPSDHDCSSAAVCEPLPEGSYTCRCVPGYVDHSPPETPGRKCVRANECRDPMLNNCSRNALCTKLTVGYSCECLPGFEDKSPGASFPGVICELPQPSFEETTHACQDPSLNDCSLQGTCKSNDSPEGYTCECPPDFVDMSPDLLNKPGRVCAPKLPVCLNRTANDCHKHAICQETASGDGYTCRCRDGYVDQSSDLLRPGRDCKEKINECLDSNLNDCDSTAICEDTETSYSCRCPLGYLDQSPDTHKPGRLCTRLINECMMPAMNNCSRFADCIDLPIGYSCSCREGYHDMNPLNAGTACVLMNECDFEALHECDPNAICRDTEDGYICYCKEGFVDVSPDPQQPGKRCIIEEPVIISTQRPVAIPIELTPCALRFCNKTLGEFCVAGIRCECPPGHVRLNEQSVCEQAWAFAFPLRVIRRNQTMLLWSSHYGNPDDVRYIEIVNLFNKGISQAVAVTRLADSFILPKVNSITPPRLHNSSWVDGLVFNYTVFMRPNDDLTPQTVWNEIMQSIQHSNFSIGGTELYIDRFQLNPFVGPQPPSGITCGPLKCNQALGEVCVNNLLCTCPYGQGRKEETHPCKELQSYTIPLLVAYNGDILLKFDNTFSSGSSPANTELEDMFTKGVIQAYRITPVWPHFIRVEMNEILDPSKFSWSDEVKGGLLFNFTVYFEKGSLEGRQTAWEELFHSCASTNYSIGGTRLYIDPLQPNPFDPCQWTDCYRNALCNSIGTDAYQCRCPDGYVDLNSALPGRQCVKGEDYNECAFDASNNCSVNAVCIDMQGRYSCECKPGFVDVSPPEGPRGRICILDYCADAPFCPVNTTCLNVPEIEGARCECNPGFLDIRGSPFVDRFPPDTYCLAIRDVDECALGLTNCSAVAICKNEDEGYSCSCPPGYVDGNPSQPGRACAAASCSLCNDHGDCIQNPETGEIGCKCHPWYTGERCDTDVRVILLFIFAAIFFLITLCCLLYFCLKCRCVRRRSLWYREPLLTQRKAFWPWSTVGASSSSESQADISAMSTSPFGIGGAKSSEHYPDFTIPRAKLKAAAQGSNGSTGEAAEAGYMRAYLDAPDAKGWKIPRARLSNDGVEREGSESVIFSDVHAGLLPGRSRVQGTIHASADAASGSSEYSDSLYEEEIIKKTKTTNVKRTEVRKIVRPEVHSTELVAVSGNEAEGNSVLYNHTQPSSCSISGCLGSHRQFGRIELLQRDPLDKECIWSVLMETYAFGLALRIPFRLSSDSISQSRRNPCRFCKRAPFRRSLVPLDIRPRLELIGNHTLFRRRCTIVSNLGHAAFLGSFAVEAAFLPSWALIVRGAKPGSSSGKWSWGAAAYFGAFHSWHIANAMSRWTREVIFLRSLGGVLPSDDGSPNLWSFPENDRRHVPTTHNAEAVYTVRKFKEAFPYGMKEAFLCDVWRCDVATASDFQMMSGKYGLQPMLNFILCVQFPMPDGCHGKGVSRLTMFQLPQVPLRKTGRNT
ncbi:EGF-like domain protein [Trichuris suis]|nr:EGF-like domain protein [Trichuris suis]